MMEFLEMAEKWVLEEDATTYAIMAVAVELRKMRERTMTTALDALTREIIAELVETLGELLIHPDQAEARARALYQRHRHILDEEETDE
jgi:hypothetical protein